MMVCVCLRQGREDFEEGEEEEQEKEVIYMAIYMAQSRKFPVAIPSQRLQSQFSSRNGVANSS